MGYTNGGYILFPRKPADGDGIKVVLCNRCYRIARRDDDIQNNDNANIITDEPCTWCGDSPNPDKVVR